MSYIATFHLGQVPVDLHTRTLSTERLGFLQLLHRVWESEETSEVAVITDVMKKFTETAENLGLGEFLKTHTVFVEAEESSRSDPFRLEFFCIVRPVVFQTLGDVLKAPVAESTSDELVLKSLLENIDLDVNFFSYSTYSLGRLPTEDFRIDFIVKHLEWDSYGGSYYEFGILHFQGDPLLVFQRAGSAEETAYENTWIISQKLKRKFILWLLRSSWEEAEDLPMDFSSTCFNLFHGKFVQEMLEEQEEQRND